MKATLTSTVDRMAMLIEWPLAQICSAISGESSRKSIR
jgi:hypothetical protein